MKKIILIIIAINFITINFSFSQEMKNFKIKTKENVKDRTAILDVFKKAMKKDYKQEFIFVVNKMNVLNNYAWFMGDVERKDGKEISFPKDEGEYDCCHVEGLLQKKNGNWYIVEYNAFSTDVWWEGICERHKAPCKIYEY